ncbi:ATP-binding protein [Paenibacillus sp. FSL P4-0176]|uniref:ATP-binding protein n=1 Tax=Paenibacillus sp. FSL P4-0176 TaxID=2921631 RepID=UPI0030D4A56E
MNSNEINAAPTKSFFIDMLIKDIPLIDAIADLVDNSVDAAINIRKDHDNFEGLEVNLNFNKDYFEINDNCGGFDTETAKNYAFRFGRPEHAPSIEKSIGRFGVGMKRALFKMGNNITIDSKTKNTYFEMNIDVQKWKEDSEKWVWEFTKVNSEEQEDTFGTKIKVECLYPEVSNVLSKSTFTDALIKEIRLSHEKVIEKGLKITINEIEINHEPSQLYVSENIKPAYFKTEVEGVNVEVIAGISKTGNPREAGWYIYCNGRLIVFADRTQLTGWGDGHPMFHPTFAMFRGYVFFDSDDSNNLPWNTTKNGIDQDSNVYQAIRPHLLNMMKPVTNFLKKLKSEPFGNDEQFENEEYETEMGLNDFVSEASLKDVSKIEKIELSKKFIAPEVKLVRKQSTQKIQYNMPVSQIDKVKEVLEVTSLKEVGEKTFEYFYRMECR